MLMAAAVPAETPTPMSTTLFCGKPPRAARPKTDGRRGERPQPGRAGDAPARRERRGGHEQHGAEPRAAGDAEDRGIRERVAGHGLHEHARERERRAREHGGEHARHAGASP